MWGGGCSKSSEKQRAWPKISFIPGHAPAPERSINEESEITAGTE